MLVSAVSTAPAVERNKVREDETLALIRDLIAKVPTAPYGVITLKIPIEGYVLQEPCGEITIRVRPPRSKR